jgi:hypothetical protein
VKHRSVRQLYLDYRAWKGMGPQTRRGRRNAKAIQRRLDRRAEQRDTEQEARWAGDENGWSE